MIKSVWTASARTIGAMCCCVLLLAAGVARADDNPRADAAQRVVEAHDPAIFVSMGALYLKQEALRAARGRPLAPTTEAEVDRVIDTNVRDTTWFTQGWAAAIDRHLSGAEAEEVAAHFATEAGKLQRRVIELALTEVLISNYTFTERIDHRLAGAEKELKTMQSVVAERQFDGPQDFSKYPDTVRFANSSAGVKYMKMIMIQGMEAITVHFEAVARQVRAVVVAAQ